ncbi:MAG TPA: Gfo/Idh/MocA family oxidoreductase [Planctomycetota bacterium]|nr:Gfo/Idh/MocA family oxidoreductase [Planctomycetota bacterium]
MKKIRLGVIGAGSRGGWFIRNKFMPTRFNQYAVSKDFELVSVVEPSDDWLAKAFPDGMGEVRREDDWRKMLKAADIDVAVIMTPDHLHEEMAVAAFRAKKHVFCEKPLALTPRGCLRVIRAADKAGKKLIIGFVLRYAPIYVKMKDLIDQGVIGKVCGVWMLHSVAGASDFYFHDWHGVSEFTNSLLLQKGSHDLDIINWIVGARPVGVTAFGARQYFGGTKPNTLVCPECDLKRTCPEFQTGPRQQCAFRREIDVDDNHVVIVRYENGVVASYNECHFTPDDNREYTFIGTEGKLYMNGAENWIRVQKRHDKGPISEFRMHALGGHGGGDDRLLEDLAKCVRGKGEPVAGAGSGYLSILVADGAARSIRQGKVVDLTKTPK